MNRQAYPNELYHYGVLGMRWGQRKASGGNGIQSKIKLPKNTSPTPRTPDEQKARARRIRRGMVVGGSILALIGAGIVADNKFAARQGLPSIIDLGKVWATKATKGSIL